MHARNDIFVIEFLPFSGMLKKSGTKSIWAVNMFREWQKQGNQRQKQGNLKAEDPASPILVQIEDMTID